MSRIIRILRSVDSEAWIWLMGLAVVAILNPYGERHFTLCLFKNLGFNFCPGCGLGRSIALLFRGDFAASFQVHPLGGPAVAVLGHRVVQLVRNSLHNNIKEKDHAEYPAAATGDRKR
jgi:hypothetical protein